MDRKGVLHGADRLWRSGDLFGAAPTYEGLVYGDTMPLVIFDLVVASREGVIKSALEVVVSHPLHDEEARFLGENRLSDLEC